MVFMIGHQVLCIENLKSGFKSLFEFSYFFLKNFFWVCYGINAPGFDGKQEIPVFFKKRIAFLAAISAWFGCATSGR